MFLRRGRSAFAVVAAALLDNCSAKIRHYTPLIVSELRQGHEKINVFFKLENLQKSGSFKDRGMRELIRTLTDEGDVRRLLSSSGGNGLDIIQFSNFNDNSNIL